MQSARSSFFPVVDYRGHIVGTLSFQDLRTIILDKPEVDTLVIAQEICHRHPPTLYPDDSLDKALQKLALRDLEFLPVVARDESQKLIGILKKSDIFRQYHRKLLDKMSQS
jgi:CIC family chloride channel protein